MKESRNQIEETHEGNFKQYDYLQAWSHDLDFSTAHVGIQKNIGSLPLLFVSQALNETSSIAVSRSSIQV